MGGLIAALSPYQKALIVAALDRYRNVISEEPVSSPLLPADRCLWIDWGAGTVSESEKAGFSLYVCSSAEKRAAAIDRLKKNHFNIIP